jgi:hypothetical protein
VQAGEIALILGLTGCNGRASSEQFIIPSLSHQKLSQYAILALANVARLLYLHDHEQQRWNMQSIDFSPTIPAFLRLTDTGDGTTSPSGSSTYSVVTSHGSSSISSGSPKPNVLETGKKRRPGRPATARRIWQQPVMKRRLVRLYLYTAESTLSTKQISKLLSALARHEENGTRYGILTLPSY